MVEVTSHQLAPGQKLSTENQSSNAIVAELRFSDGAEMSVVLHPGATLDMKVGTGPVTIILKDADGPQHLRLVD